MEFFSLELPDLPEYEELEVHVLAALDTHDEEEALLAISRLADFQPSDALSAPPEILISFLSHLHQLMKSHLSNKRGLLALLLARFMLLSVVPSPDAAQLCYLVLKALSECDLSSVSEDSIEFIASCAHQMFLSLITPTVAFELHIPNLSDLQQCPGYQQLTACQRPTQRSVLTYYPPLCDLHPHIITRLLSAWFEFLNWVQCRASACKALDRHSEQLECYHRKFSSTEEATTLPQWSTAHRLMRLINVKHLVTSALSADVSSASTEPSFESCRTLIESWNTSSSLPDASTRLTHQLHRWLSHCTAHPSRQFESSWTNALIPLK